MANHSFRGVILSALKHNKDGSFATQANRKNILLKACKDLKNAGYDKVSAKNFGAKHCYILRDHWKDQAITTATIKNRLACVRWLGEKVGKELPDNKKLEIANRVYSDNTKNKAQEVDNSKFVQLETRHQLSLELQREFGLRLEESIKFNVSYADKSDKIELKASWTKGGRAREIPVRTESQKDLLSRLHSFCGKESLIPSEKNYIQARWTLEKACQKIGIKNLHGFRHMYAQERYKVMTGRDCPKADGLISKELTLEQKNLDYKARMLISNELGHNREEITAQYLGR
jgi:integrase